ncbi:DoxX-like family protein, partial [Ferrovibrio sp.]|uniref:DoxX-like family protein n=1 Tax=Ferrovibrio sp. TaxID=1917215 RepID=UPI002616DA31
AWLGEWFGRGPVSRNALAQMRYGNTGDAAGFARAIGWQPASMAEALRRHPSHVQDRWHARLYWLRPATRVALALLWLVSGAIGLFAGPDAVQPVLDLLRLPMEAGRPLALLFSGIDILLGLGLLLRRPGAGLLTLVQLAMVGGYTAILSLADPGLWLEPYGPLLKNLPILVLIAIHWALDDDR